MKKILIIIFIFLWSFSITKADKNSEILEIRTSVAIEWIDCKKIENKNYICYVPKNTTKNNKENKNLLNLTFSIFSKTHPIKYFLVKNFLIITYPHLLK